MSHLRVLMVGGQGDPGQWQAQWARLDACAVQVDSTRLLAELAVGPVVLVVEGPAAEVMADAAHRSSIVGALVVDPVVVGAVTRLPFPAIVVGLGEARALAAAWGARFVDERPQPGTWPAGRALLQELCRLAPFALDPRLAADTTLVARGPLSEVLLFDDARYVWLVLVPRRSAVTELYELDAADRLALADESHVLALSLARAFTPDKVNVAALGNVVRQLHVHYVARWLGDAAWPAPVWGHSPREPRTSADRDLVVERLWRVEEFSRKFTRA